jgi:hypothetical protein
MKMLVASILDQKMIDALSVIATTLHPAFDEIVAPGKSKESCVLCSLAVRDFLFQAGWKDATCTTVYMMIVASDVHGKEIWSLGVGDHANIPTVGPAPVDTAERWSGHMVVEVPSAGIIIDTTMFPAMREKYWPKLPGMAAVMINNNGPMSYGLQPVAGLASDDLKGSVRVVWLRQPNKRWQGAPDAVRSRRLPVVKSMLHALRMFA